MYKFIIFFVVFVACQAVTDNEGRVTNGKPAILGQFPWQAAIHLRGDYVCLGVLLDKTHVITTLTCATQLNPIGDCTVHLGSLVAADDRFLATCESITEQSTGTAGEDELAIVKLTGGPNLSENIHGIGILHHQEITFRTSASASGWGINNAQIHLNLQYVDLDVWKATLGIQSIANTNHACLWDQGTGLVHMDESTLMYTLIGIARDNSDSCEATPIPSQYISTYKHRDWINTVLSKK